MVNQAHQGAIAELSSYAAAGNEDWASLGKIKAAYRDALVILSYTKEAKGPEDFTAIEEVCRGLILEMGTGRVVARPFPKFWNWGQLPAKSTKIKWVQEKMDGSLGVYYQYKGENCIATRGSFESDQAKWATDHLQMLYPDTGLFLPTCTPLFEIIYPENRIVLDYGTRRELSFLASIDKETGLDGPSFHHLFQGAWLHTSKKYSVDHLLELCQSETGIEGFVVMMEDGTRWKFKTEDYRKLHRMATQFTPKAVLEALFSGNLQQAWEATPDHRREEFAEALITCSRTVLNQLIESDSILARLKPLSRKDSALFLKENAPALMGLVFARMDNKAISPILEKACLATLSKP